jgi:hypothetical protein
MMEAAPASPFEVGVAEFAFEFLVVALDAPAQFGVSTRTSMGVSSGRVESQYFVGSFSPSGHSMSSHASGWGVETFQSHEAGRIRTAAKREDKISLTRLSQLGRRAGGKGCGIKAGRSKVSTTWRDRLLSPWGRIGDLRVAAAVSPSCRRKCSSSRLLAVLETSIRAQMHGKPNLRQTILLKRYLVSTTRAFQNPSLN